MHDRFLRQFAHLGFFESAFLNSEQDKKKKKIFYFENTASLPFPSMKGKKNIVTVFFCLHYDQYNILTGKESDF